ncbi:MAG TPA: tRNA (adenosine(37)-N6)-dimethylallyltransferase MiaA, partial [Candidatus Kapabacteria bacterium]
IGTAKPSKAIREQIPHYLIDILEPSERFSAADYSKQGRDVIRDIISRNHTPIVVGGTGFYIDALFFGLSSIEVDDALLANVRQKYNAEFNAHGFDVMLAKLGEFDTVLFEQVTRERNPVRLERAFIHYYATGTPLGVARLEKPEPFEYEPKYTVLTVERDELLRRIELRVGEMLAAGWLDEVRLLLQSGITTDMPAMRAIGYSELAEVIHGTMTIQEAREKIIIGTRQYAKRQTTWMKRYQKM